MSLNPTRHALAPVARGFAAPETPFRDEADVVLASFRSGREDLERRVRRGDLTPKAAREQATAAAAQLRDTLLRRSEGFSPAPRVFLDRLVAEGDARKRARQNPSLEALQRETNRLLRRSLIEQQLSGRSAEFEARAFVRPMAGGVPAPTAEGLLAFHRESEAAGDDAALEWARRQLEAIRPRVLDESDVRRIDRATDRPDRVNPRTVARYVEALRDQAPEVLETFVAEALEARDASACAAGFVLAREAPEGLAARWARALLDGLKDVPDAALESLRAWESDARRRDAEAARAAAEGAIALAEAEARLPGLEAPSDADLRRLARGEALPVARPDEPIGLAARRRGLLPEEFAAAAELAP